MPEGPEVKRIGLSLAKRLTAKKIKNIEIMSGRYAKKEPSGIKEISNHFPLSIVGCGVHGKFIYFICNNEWSIWNTLGMTGYWSPEKQKHSRLKFVLNDGEIYFNDMRNFGTIKFVRGKFNLIQKLESLGVDMLSNPPTDEVFITKLRKKPNWSLAKVLMDQSIISGVGNYIKADALWLSKLSPKRKVSDCTSSQLAFLNTNIQSVMRSSYESGGATIQSYKNFNGDIGGYTEKMLVYGRKTDLHGNEVIKEQTDDGRTTHWVPSIQK